jgi:hypothetical protein
MRNGLLGVLVAILLLLLPGSARAQLLRGGLEGTVLDAARIALAGARVSLRGAGGVRETKSDARGRISLLGLDPGIYSLRVESEGFLAAEYSSLSINAGQVTSVLVQMSPVPGETVTVTAEPPGTDLAAQPALTLRREELARLPSTRDPWAIALRAPGVLALGHNHGGSESGQQFYLSAGGVAPSENEFLLDGVVVTDVLAAGASLGYFDFEQFDEIGVAAGRVDPAAGNAGVTISLVTRRATDRWRGSARFLRLDGDSQPRGTELQRRFAARVEAIDEWGGEAGGPIAPRHLWAWASYGASAIERLSFFGTPVDVDLANTAGKLSFVAGPVSGVLLAQRGEKTWLGRGVGVGRPPETGIDQRGPFDLVKAEGHWSLSDRWSLETSLARTDADFSLTNASRGDIVVGPDGAWSGGFPSSTRESTSAQWRSELFGTHRWGAVPHDHRLGLEYREQIDGWRDWLGEHGLIYYAPLESSQPWSIEADQMVPSRVRERYRSLWAADTVQGRRLSVQVGARYDGQDGSRLATEAPSHPSFPEFLPAFAVDERSIGEAWHSVSPRLAAAASPGGGGRSTIRASLARFPARLNGNRGMLLTDESLRGAVLSWADADGDHRWDTTEAITSVTRFGWDDGLLEPRGIEPEYYDALGLGLERRLGRSALVALDWTLRRASNLLETRTLVRDNGAVRHALRTDYQLAQVLEVVGEGGSVTQVPVFSLSPALEVLGETLLNGDRSHQYQAVTLSWRRPFDGGWAVQGHWTSSDWRWRIGPEFRRHDDPTDMAASEGRFGASSADSDGDVAGFFGTTPGGSGRGAGFLANTRWDYGLALSWAVAPSRPWGVLTSLSLSGRDGYPVARARRVTVAPGRSGLAQVGSRTDAQRGEGVHLVDLRVEKPLRLGPFSAALSLDVFNLANADTVLQVNRTQASGGPQPVEVITPRIVRLGVRLSFE